MKEKLNLKNPVTGKQIVEAVQKIAKGDFVKMPASDDHRKWIIGRKSRALTDIAIEVGSRAVAQIEMHETYTEVYVSTWDFGGGKYKVPYNSDAAQSAVDQFAGELEKII